MNEPNPPEGTVASPASEVELAEAADELALAVTNLADARAEREDLRRKLDGLQVELRESVTGKKIAGLEQKLADAKIREDALYDAACAQALAAFDGKDKHPHLAVTITDTAEVQYDPHGAFEYALRNLTVALKFDAKVFEKIARDVGLPCAQIIMRLKPKIAADLSAYRSQGEEEPLL
jgi:hypothetical protein